MSGPICPDCGLLALVDAGAGYLKCPICGWSGASPPRTILSGEIASELWTETREKLALREKGKLFCYRITLRGRENTKSDAKSAIMDILDLHQMVGADLLLIFRTERVGETQVEQIKMLRSVKEVMVF